MRARGLLALLLLLSGILSWGWGGEAKELEVRVLLLRTEETLLLSSPAGLKVSIGKQAFAVSPKRVLHFSPEVRGILWQEKNIVAPRVQIIPRDGIVFVGKRPYRGRLELREKEGRLEVVNILSLDDYVKGTVKLEVNPNWPEEALKACIIVARTYALRNLGRHRDEGFDFCGTVHCQRYGGVFAEDPKTSDLVEETRGIIVTYEGQPASVVFHSESGGYTDSAENVWGKEIPYLVEVPSPWEEDAPHASWQVVLSRGEITEALQRRGYIQGEVLGLRCRESEKSGRVVAVTIHTDCGERELTGNQFREAIGFDRLPSTFFHLVTGPSLWGNPLQEDPAQEHSSGEHDILNYEEWMERDWSLDDIITFLKLREREREERKRTKKPEALLYPVQEEVEGETGAFIFAGRGWGHGVGLSQWGAAGMAKRGANFAEILHHYFPGCELGRVVVR